MNEDNNLFCFQKRKCFRSLEQETCFHYYLLIAGSWWPISWFVYQWRHLRSTTSRDSNEDVTSATSFLPPANEVCEGYVFTGVCLSTGGACVVACRGGAWLLGGACVVAHRVGMHGCSWGACVVAPGGACMVAPGGACCGWSWWGVHGCSWGACVVAPGGCAWFAPGGACVVAPGERGWFFRWDTVNERAVRILLKCILV